MDVGPSELARKNWHTDGFNRGANLIDWLLEGPAFVRYRTLVDILDCPVEDMDARQARAEIAHESAINQLLNRRNEAGYWGAPDDIFKWWPKKDTTFWVLGILADFGLTRGDCGIERACEYVLSTQLSCGAFGLRPPPKPYDCFTGVLAGSLAKLGYADDERLENAYLWLACRQRNDGGFWCKNTGQPGGPRENEPSCALASLYVLSAFNAHPTLKNGEVCRMCAAFLLSCWDHRGKIKYAGHDSQIGSGWEKLKYPFNDYHILHFLDVLSYSSVMGTDKRAVDMVNLVRSRGDRDGRFTPESINKAWCEFDFGQKQLPSKWLTFLVYRIEDRLRCKTGVRLPL